MSELERELSEGEKLAKNLVDYCVNMGNTASCEIPIKHFGKWIVTVKSETDVARTNYIFVLKLIKKIRELYSESLRNGLDHSNALDCSLEELEEENRA